MRLAGLDPAGVFLGKAVRRGGSADRARSVARRRRRRSSTARRCASRSLLVATALLATAGLAAAGTAYAAVAARPARGNHAAAAAAPAGSRSGPAGRHHGPGKPDWRVCPATRLAGWSCWPRSRCCTSRSVSSDTAPCRRSHENRFACSARSPSSRSTGTIVLGLGPSRHLRTAHVLAHVGAAPAASRGRRTWRSASRRWPRCSI